MPEPTFFAAPAELRDWLERNGESEAELIVGFHKKRTGKPSLSWEQARDEALCFGWIDGVGHSLGDDAFTVRLTPRRERSVWSRVNVERFAELLEGGRVRPPGIAAYERRSGERAGVDLSEQRRRAELPAGYERRLREDRAASEFFESQPPGYRRSAIHWVVSAKREETRERRLETMIADSAAGRRVKPLRR